MCCRQAHTGGLVKQVWTGSLLFTSSEGDVANRKVIMKILATVALLHLYLSATGEFLLGLDSQVTQVSLKKPA